MLLVLVTAKGREENTLRNSSVPPSSKMLTKFRCHGYLDALLCMSHDTFSLSAPVQEGSGGIPTIKVINQK